MSGGCRSSRASAGGGRCGRESGSSSSSDRLLKRRSSPASRAPSGPLSWDSRCVQRAGVAQPPSGSDRCTLSSARSALRARRGARARPRCRRPLPRSGCAARRYMPGGARGLAEAHHVPAPVVDAGRLIPSTGSSGSRSYISSPTTRIREIPMSTAHRANRASGPSRVHSRQAEQRPGRRRSPRRAVSDVRREPPSRACRRGGATAGAPPERAIAPS